MTGTTLKDVGSAFGSLPIPGASGAKNASQGGFQKVWDSQSGRSGTEDAGTDIKPATRTTKGDSLRTREDNLVRKAPVQTESEEPVKELSQEELEEIMSVLETAAGGMVQQVAEVLNISVEEVQGAMEELGMEPLDMLNRGKLGELFLKVAGAEDSYALVTNESLYDGYQTLMGELQNVLQEVSEDAGLTAEQFTDLLTQVQNQQMTDMPEENAEPLIQVETISDEEQPVQTKETEQPEMQTNASEAAEGTKLSELAGEQNTDGQKSGAEEKGENQNLLLQHVRAEQAQPKVQQTVQNTQVWDADTQDIMRQIMDYMKIQLKPDMSNLEMQLHPESLGTVQVHVASKGGVVTANFVTQNEAVKAALESQMVQLQQSFEEQGIKVNAIEVSVQTNEFQRNLDQGRGGNRNQSSERKGRTRRINLDDALNMDDMTEEDALAADMLAAGGNTVDYTA